jgi:hypothetical protein
MQDLLNGINFTNPTWDAFIFFFWIVISLIYSFAAGRGRIIAILVAVYMAELLVIQAPFLSTTVENQFGLTLYLARLTTFLVLFAFFFLILSRYVFRTAVESSRSLFSWFYSFIFAILQVGFLISVILSFLPDATKQSFAPLVKMIFISQTAAFIWLLLPIAFLVIIGHKISEHRIE